MKLFNNLRKSLRFEVVASIMVIVVMAGFLNAYVTFQMKDLKSYNEDINAIYLPATIAVSDMEHSLNEMSIALNQLSTGSANAESTINNAVSDLSATLDELEALNQSAANTELDQTYANVVASYGALSTAAEAISKSNSQENISQLNLAIEDMNAKV